MPIKVTCPKCNGVLHAPDDSGGKRGRCPTCGTVLNIPAGGGGEAPSQPGFSLRSGAPPTASDHPFAGERGGSSLGGAVAMTPPAKSPPAPATYGLADPGSGAAIRSPGAAVAPPPSRPVEPTRKVPPPPPLPSRPTTPQPFGLPLGTVPEDARRWKSVASGLRWVQVAIVFLMLAAIIPAGLFIYESLSAPLPVPAQGVLKIQGLSGINEVYLGSIAIPAVLGLLALLLGRFKVASAPSSAYTGGTAILASLGTLLTVAGLVAAAVPAVMTMTKGTAPQELTPVADVWGITQRLSLAAALGFFLASELWFVTALGKIGAALHAARPAGRSGRLMGLIGLLVVLGIVGAVGYTVYPDDVNNWLIANVQPQWDKLADRKPSARAGVVIAGALIAGLIGLRLTGATRRAVREWLEVNPTA